MEDKKRRAGEKAVDWVEDGMVLGLGTGSTAYFAIRAIGEMVREGYDLRGVPTSKRSEELAVEMGIPLVSLNDVDRIDLTIDGADEVDPSLNLIKGLGGALVREKIVAYASEEEIIVVDDSKMVEALGTKSPLPVEVVQFGNMRTKRSIESLGCEVRLRGGAEPFVTDNGNLIYDCHFGRISEPRRVTEELNAIPGVVDNGLFLGLVSRVVVGKDGSTEVLEKTD